MAFFSNPLRRSARDQESAGRAMDAGPTDPLARFNPFKAGKEPWLVEWQKRRQAVADQYWRDKRSLLKKKRYAGKQLREELKRRKEEAERYYGLPRMRANDAQRSQAERRSELKFEAKERELQRKFDRGWRGQLRGLQRGRDQQKRGVTKQMRREYRASRDW